VSLDNRKVSPRLIVLRVYSGCEAGYRRDSITKNTAKTQGGTLHIIS